PVGCAGAVAGVAAAAESSVANPAMAPMAPTSFLSMKLLSLWFRFDLAAQRIRRSEPALHENQETHIRFHLPARTEHRGRLRDLALSRRLRAANNITRLSISKDLVLPVELAGTIGARGGDVGRGARWGSPGSAHGRCRPPRGGPHVRDAAPVHRL